MLHCGERFPRALRKIRHPVVGRLRQPIVRHSKRGKVRSFGVGTTLAHLRILNMSNSSHTFLWYFPWDCITGALPSDLQCVDMRKRRLLEFALVL